MSPSGSPNRSRREVLSFASTFRASGASSCLQPDRDSAGSIYHDYCHDYCHDLANDYAVQQPYQPYLPYQLYPTDQRSRVQSRRPASVLPAAQSDYYQTWETVSTRSYSASLHPPSSSCRPSSPCKPISTSFFHPANSSTSLRRNRSFAKRSVRPVVGQDLCEELAREVIAFQTSRQSSETWPSTPAYLLLPALSFSSTKTSPFSIMTHGSSRDMSLTYGMAEHVEQPREKRKALPKRLALGHVQPRNISSPFSSPTFLDFHGATAGSYPRLASSPCPALINPMEVSVFDDSDDEEGKFSHHVKKLKSAVSLQNLHAKSRARAESSARNAPPLPTPSPGADWTSDAVAQRGSNGSLRPRHSKDSAKSISPTVATTSFDGISTAPVARLQRKISVSRSRSNTASFTSSPPSPPPNTPVPRTPKLTIDRRHSRMSWYQCFSRVEPVDHPSLVIAKPKKRDRKASKRSSKESSPGKVRVFFAKVFRLRK